MPKRSLLIKNITFFTISLLFLYFFSGCKRDKEAHQRFLEKCRRIGNKKVSWELVESLNFDNQQDILNYKVINGKWQISNGKLIATEGEENRTIFLFPSRYDIAKLEFDATNYGRGLWIGDITVLFNSVEGDGYSFFKSGYSLTTGSFWNNCSTFYRLGKPVCKTEAFNLVSGKKYHIKVILKDGHIRYWVDNMLLLEYWDISPLKMDEKLFIGLRTWNTEMHIDNLKLYSGFYSG